MLNSVMYFVRYVGPESRVTSQISLSSKYNICTTKPSQKFGKCLHSAETLLQSLLI